jgi:hypothetical protein
MLPSLQGNCQAIIPDRSPTQSPLPDQTRSTTKTLPKSNRSPIFTASSHLFSSIKLRDSRMALGSSKFSVTSHFGNSARMSPTLDFVRPLNDRNLIDLMVSAAHKVTHFEETALQHSHPFHDSLQNGFNSAASWLSKHFIHSENVKNSVDSMISVPVEFTQTPVRTLSLQDSSSFCSSLSNDFNFEHVLFSEHCAQSVNLNRSSEIEFPAPFLETLTMKDSSSFHSFLLHDFSSAEVPISESFGPSSDLSTSIDPIISATLDITQAFPETLPLKHSPLFHSSFSHDRKSASIPVSENCGQSGNLNISIDPIILAAIEFTQIFLKTHPLEYSTSFRSSLLRFLDSAPVGLSENMIQSETLKKSIDPLLSAALQDAS